MTYKHDWPAFQAALARAELLMLDFDGPICSVFSGLPAPEVADRLRDDFRRTFVGQPSGFDDVGDDPFETLRYVASHSPGTLAEINERLTSYECEAVQLATPTSGAHDLIKTWVSTGRPLAIVSNNSVDAIRMYLSLHDLSDLVGYVAARTIHTVEKIKPCPYLLNTALAAMDIDPGGAVLLGDSIADMKAAAAAGVSRLAFANRPEKLETMGPISDILIDRFETFLRS